MTFLLQLCGVHMFSILHFHQVKASFTLRRKRRHAWNQFLLLSLLILLKVRDLFGQEFGHFEMIILILMVS